MRFNWRNHLVEWNEKFHLFFFARRGDYGDNKEILVISAKFYLRFDKIMKSYKNWF